METMNCNGVFVVRDNTHNPNTYSPNNHNPNTHNPTNHKSEANVSAFFSGLLLCFSFIEVFIEKLAFELKFSFLFFKSNEEVWVITGNNINKVSSELLWKQF